MGVVPSNLEQGFVAGSHPSPPSVIDETVAAAITDESVAPATTDETVEAIADSPVVQRGPPPGSLIAVNEPPSNVLEVDTIEPAGDQSAPEKPDTSGPDPDARYAYDNVDQPPTALSTRLPAFAARGRKAARGNSLSLVVLVTPSGRISSVQVVEGYPDEDLRRAAVGAVLRWRFTGGSHRGVPVRVWVPVRLDFDIDGGELRATVTSPGR